MAGGAAPLRRRQPAGGSGGGEAALPDRGGPARRRRLRPGRVEQLRPHNSLEDVDLCLRIGAAGDEIHYCDEAVLVHLESASRGREDRFEPSVALYRERWRDRVRRDDLDAYVADGLLRVEYADSHPIRLSVDPTLAIVDRGREEEIERLLEGYARQSADLLRELVRLTAAAASTERSSPRYAGADASVSPDGSAGFDRVGFLRRVREIEEEIRQLQAEAAPATGIDPSSSLGYGNLVERVRGEVEERVPAGAKVLVVSRGDRDLVRLGERQAAHFPQAEDGGYAGYHPADSEAAIAELERLREDGAEYLVLPAPSIWWLEHYGGFADHLGRYRSLGDGDCEIFDLRAERASANTIPR